MEHECLGVDKKFMGYSPNNFDPIHICEECGGWWGFDASMGWYLVEEENAGDLLHYRDTPRGRETAEYVAYYKALALKYSDKLKESR